MCQTSPIHFGVFELDLRSRELRKHGVRVKLQDQPFEVLQALLERPGELVTREELRTRIWGSTFVDFDQSLNRAVTKVRAALCDDSENPRFIETLQKRGYRFIAPVNRDAVPPHKPAAATLEAGSAPSADRVHLRSSFLWMSAAVTLTVAAFTLGWWLLQPPYSTHSRAVPLTALPGQVSSPSFSPDGSRVAFAWNGYQQDNYDIYVKQIGMSSLVRLTNHTAPDTNPVWSPDDRYIAFRRSVPGGVTSILLMPSIGGPERKLAEMSEARGPLTWTPDARWLAVSGRNSVQERTRIWLISADTGEKRPLTQPGPGAADISPSISPDGAMLAFGRGTAEFVVRPYVLRLSPDRKPLGEPRMVTPESDFAVSYAPVGVSTGGIAWANSREIVYSAGGAQTLHLW